ncbi:MAG: hypothetical protein IT330_12355 [Anaerolineae bacterium]|nr:hypothetical protein [Anaerolineae bacterium]
MPEKQWPAVGSGGRGNGAGERTSQPIYTTNTAPRQVVRVGERVVGTIFGDILSKAIVGSRHLLRRPPAICWAVSAIEEARRAGVHLLRVADSESGKTYSVSLADFQRYAFEIEHSGFERQLACPLHRWQTVRLGEPEMQQLAFWGMS